MSLAIVLGTPRKLRDGAQLRQRWRGIAAGRVVKDGELAAPKIILEHLEHCLLLPINARMHRERLVEARCARLI